VISSPLSSGLSRFQKRFDLCGIEEILGPMWVSRSTLNIIRGGEVEHWCGFVRSLWCCRCQLFTEGGVDSDEHVIAARHSIMADAVESSFIVNGKRNAPCERGRGGWGGAKLSRSQPANTPHQILQKFPIVLRSNPRAPNCYRSR